MTRQYDARDFWIGVFVFAFALVFLALSQTQVSFETDGFDNISGRTFPYIIGGVQLILGAALMAWNWPALKLANSTKGCTFNKARTRRIAIYAGSILVYTVMIYYIGYLVSTFAALVFALWFSGAKRNLATFLVALVTPLLMYYVFHVLMQIPFPESLLI